MNSTDILSGTINWNARQTRLHEELKPNWFQTHKHGVIVARAFFFLTLTLTVGSLAASAYFTVKIAVAALATAHVTAYLAQRLLDKSRYEKTDAALIVENAREMMGRMVHGRVSLSVLQAAILPLKISKEDLLSHILNKSYAPPLLDMCDFYRLRYESLDSDSISSDTRTFFRERFLIALSRTNRNVALSRTKSNCETIMNEYATLISSLDLDPNAVKEAFYKGKEAFYFESASKDFYALDFEMICSFSKRGRDRVVSRFRKIPLEDSKKHLDMRVWLRLINLAEIKLDPETVGTLINEIERAKLSSVSPADIAKRAQEEAELNDIIAGSIF